MPEADRIMPSRREALKAAPALAFPLAVLAASAEASARPAVEASAGARLRALEAEWRRLRDAAQAVFDREDYDLEDEDEAGALLELSWGVEDEVAAAPATCASDVAVKARMALDHFELGDDDRVAVTLRSLAALAEPA